MDPDCVTCSFKQYGGAIWALDGVVAEFREGSLWSRGLRLLADGELPALLEHVQFDGLPAELGFDALARHACDRMCGNDCYHRTASMALELYGVRSWPEASRFTVALLSIQMSALAHRWVRIGESRYPCTPAWFRLFNTPNKLAEHLAANFAAIA